MVRKCTGFFLFFQGGHDPFALQQYHMQQMAKNHRRILHPGHQVFLAYNPPPHHTANILDTPLQMELPIGPKSHSGPTMLNVFSSNAMGNTTVSCKVKVEPLVDTFLGPAAEVLQHHQDPDATSPFYGTLQQRAAFFNPNHWLGLRRGLQRHYYYYHHHKP